jgi:class 3 adenylate cyclase
MLTENGADIVKFAGDAVMAVWEVPKRGMGGSPRWGAVQVECGLQP